MTQQKDLRGLKPCPIILELDEKGENALAYSPTSNANNEELFLEQKQIVQKIYQFFK